MGFCLRECLMRFFWWCGFFDCVAFWLCEFDCASLVLVLIVRVWCGFFDCVILIGILVTRVWLSHLHEFG